MRMPYANPVQSQTAQGNTFQGYRREEFGSVNAFWDMQNMTGLDSPVIRTRDKRRKVRTLQRCNGLFGREQLGWVDGTALWYGGKQVGTVEDSAKTFVHMGAYTVIMPDKLMYNTATGELLPMENRVTVSNIQYASVDMLGESQDAMEALYVRMSAGGIGRGFKSGDVVLIENSKVESLNGYRQLQTVTDNEIVLLGTMGQNTDSQPGSITLSRTTPDMDYMTESDNRIWGCSSEKHEVYACKLGDPTNWHSYQGLASDAYALTIGSVGDFTGACTHLGYVYFFKENVHHKLFGNKPANYQLTNSHVRGVEKGSDKSLCILHETLYYLSPDGICASQGALPSQVDKALGNVQYKNAVSGSAGKRMWVSMEAENGNVLFTFDIETGAWHKEDNVRAKAFANVGNHLYMLDDQNVIWCMTGMGDTELEDATAAWEEALPYMVETGEMDMANLFRKRLQKIHLRMTLEHDASCGIYVQYDGGEWKELLDVKAGKDLKSMVLPIIPRRCDRMRIRLQGSGMMRLYNLNTITQGGTEIG